MIKFRYFNITLFISLLLIALPSHAINVSFSDFSTGFDTANDTGSQMLNGVTFSYSDDDTIDLNTATSTGLNINNGGAALTGQVTLSFSGAPINHSLDLSVSGFFFPSDNGESLGMFNIAPTSVITNGSSWDGTTLSTTDVMPGTAIFHFDSVPSELIFSYGSSTNFTNFLITDVTISAVPVPAAAWLFGSALLGFVGIAKRKRG